MLNGAMRETGMAVKNMACCAIIENYVKETITGMTGRRKAVRDVLCSNRKLTVGVLTGSEMVHKAAE